MAENATPEKKKRTPLTAKNRVMDLLARRDHSEKELREKLRDHFSGDEIDQAIDFARNEKWLKDGAELAEKFAAQMHGRKKGLNAINHKLREMGLPAVQADPEEEFETALELARSKAALAKKGADPGEGAALGKAEREKIGRFLISRGFAPGIVRKVVYEKL